MGSYLSNLLTPVENQITSLKYNEDDIDFYENLTDKVYKQYILCNSILKKENQKEWTKEYAIKSLECAKQFEALNKQFILIASNRSIEQIKILSLTKRLCNIFSIISEYAFRVCDLNSELHKESIYYLKHLEICPIVSVNNNPEYIQNQRESECCYYIYGIPSIKTIPISNGGEIVCTFPYSLYDDFVSVFCSNCTKNIININSTKNYIHFYFEDNVIDIEFFIDETTQLINIIYYNNGLIHNDITFKPIILKLLENTKILISLKETNINVPLERILMNSIHELEVKIIA